MNELEPTGPKQILNTVDQHLTRWFDLYVSISELRELLPSTARDEVCCHFLSRFLSLLQKLQIAGRHPSYQLWIAVEELRLLFDAHAAWVRVPVADRGTASQAGDPIWEVATLTESEKTLLEGLVAGTQAPKARFAKRAKGVRWEVFERPLREHFGIQLKNSNLAAVDGVLVVDIRPLGRTPWQMVVFMTHTQELSTRRLSTSCCEAILAGSGEDLRAAKFVHALSQLPLTFGTLLPLEPRGAPWTIHKDQFEQECGVDNPHRFPRRYQERFQGIHSILGELYEQMDETLGRERSAHGATTTLLFSYRSPDQDFICFFPTARQAEEFVKSREDLKDFLFFWRFPYPRSKAISGWVLATGMCDYTERFYADLRWTDWIEGASSEDKPHIAKQLSLVRKFFKAENDEDQPFAYLLPIVLWPRHSTGQLEPMLMASITSSLPLDCHVRGALFDLCCRLSRTAEMALTAQLNLEDVYVKEAEVRAEAAFAAGLAHELPQPVTRLSYAIDSLSRTLSELNLSEPHLDSASEDIDRARQSIQEIMDLKNTMAEYARLRNDLSCKLAEFDLRVTIETVVDRFCDFLRITGVDRIRVIRSLSPDTASLTADEGLVRIMLNNLLKNASEALEKGGEIRVSAQLVGDSTVEIRVADNGPGMPSEVRDLVIRGIRRTTKEKGIGIGLPFVYLCCAAHGGSFDIKTDPQIGTAVIVQLPLRGPDAAGGSAP